MNKFNQSQTLKDEIIYRELVVLKEFGEEMFSKPACGKKEKEK